ncbi:MAG TPA: type I 3-dehydroquinate dehydratase [Vicinamibacterales bacterium]
MRDPQLTVTVTGKTMEELRQARDAAADADIVELRLDGVAEPDPIGAIHDRRRPVIVTCRPAWEGGSFAGSEEERERILTAALDGGAEFVDVEANARFAPALIARTGGRRIVLSLHAFGPVPADLAERAREMQATGAEVVKIAISAERLTDMLPLLSIAGSPSFARRDGESGHVLIAMGNAGVASRVLAARFGNRWTYAGEGVAPGQLSPAEMLGAMRFRRIRPDAAIYGIVGNPVMHSLSPVLHNAAFAALGLNAAYVPLQASDVDDFLAFASAIGIRGASVTAPFKVDMLAKIADEEPLARRVGAINTLVLRDGRWFGANTDVEGFLGPLAGRITLKGTRATILGAGGAARAVAAALASQGAAVTVSARRAEAAAAVAALAGGTVGTWPPRPGSWDVLVNATPVGRDSVPVDGLWLDGEIVFDLVYVPAETRLIAAARQAGCLAIGGIEMLVAQAERQFELWTGQRPPAGLMRATAAQATGARDLEPEGRGER